MPGMNANLTNAAYAIWEQVPQKKRRAPNSMGGPMEPGRSAWISSVIVEHAGWVERYNKLLDQKMELERDLLTAKQTLNDLQKRIHEE